MIYVFIIDNYIYNNEVKIHQQNYVVKRFLTCRCKYVYYAAAILLPQMFI